MNPKSHRSPTVLDKDFTIATFASTASVSRNTVYRLINSGAISAYKILNSTRIPFDQLEKLKKENQIKPGTMKSNNPRGKGKYKKDFTDDLSPEEVADVHITAQ